MNAEKKNDKREYTEKITGEISETVVVIVAKGVIAVLVSVSAAVADV